MVLSLETKNLLEKISKTSGNRLLRSMDFAQLMELGHQTQQQNVLDDLAFRAKFIIKSHELLKRIGHGGVGYDKLIAEFSANIEKVREEIKLLIVYAASDVNMYFIATYLSMTDVSMKNLVELSHDLSWYKNYLIDFRHKLE